ncbi:MAG: hypothetical protein AAGB26_16780 [Planctomycetota bacterium]
MSRPELIAIEPDEYHASHCGVTSEGKQYFLTTLFEHAIEGKEGCEYVALFLFDQEGNIIESKTVIESFGPRITVNDLEVSLRIKALLISLGETQTSRIEIRPFQINKFGTKFGFLARSPEEEDDEWAVELMPGNYMAFFEPWDSGEYDT